MIFKSTENLKKRYKKLIYDVGADVSSFFFDEAPEKKYLEKREGQQDMAFEILDALRNEQHIVVEAGVGIGKSYAYLVPLMLLNKQSRKPVAIATSTITLQEQLLDDVYRLKKMLNIEQEVTLVKGQSHYLCLKRIGEYLEQPNVLMQDQLRNSDYIGFRERKDFPFTLPQAVWEKINVTRYSKRSCSKCRHNCYYHQLRKHLKKAKGIIICNQDLLTAHLINQNNGRDSILSQDIEVVVIDEAHNLEDKVRSATTEKYSQRGIESQIDAALKEMTSDAHSVIQEDVFSDSTAESPFSIR